MHKLVTIELFKIFTRPRTYIGFAAIVIIVLSIQTGFYFEGEELLSFVLDSLKDRFIFQGTLLNSYTIAYVILNTLWIHVPILVALVTGDLIAGEANGGTFRVILTRPVSRTKLIFAKFFAGFTYAGMLVILLMVFTLGIGHLMFGPGDFIVLKSSVNIINQDEALWRFILAFAYGILSMTVVVSLSLMLSAFTDNSIGPIIGTLAIIIGITVISTLGFSLLQPVMPFLFTTYLSRWNLFFDSQPDIIEILQAVGIQLGYIILFFSVTLIYFKRKDILS
ncbi:MAG: ABC transporter permease [Bacteroidota bacterium]